MEIRVRGYGKSFKAGFNECNEMWKEKIREKIKWVDELYNNAETDEFGTKAFYGYDFIMDMLNELLGEWNLTKNNKT